MMTSMMSHNTQLCYNLHNNSVIDHPARLIYRTRVQVGNRGGFGYDDTR